MQNLMDECRNQDQCQGQPKILVAGDPERQHMKLCDKLGGIPYHLNQVKFAVSFVINNILRELSW